MKKIVILLVLVLLGAVSILGAEFKIEQETNLPAKVERVGTLFSGSGYIVTMLGAGDKIVAVNRGLKKDQKLKKINPAVAQARQVKASRSINIEELARANPDLIFVRQLMLENEREVQKLNQLGIPYLTTDYKSIDQQQKVVQRIGKALGTVEKAKEFNHYYNQIIEMVSKRVTKIPQQERVKVFHSLKEPTRTDNTASLATEWIKVAGGINVAANKDLKLTKKNKYYASLEQIMNWNPEVIIVDQAGVDEQILNNNQWSSLSAVKDNRVYQIPEGISRWGHPSSIETPLAILWLAKELYPQRFEDTNLVAEVREFYQRFFDINLTTTEAKEILTN
ncbi:MAG: ABC transporter substrate-binding protein [Bacillota bacterium]